MRTTIDIDASVLKELKRLSKSEDKALGQVASELLARALAERRKSRPRPAFRWIARPMAAKVDLDDKEAVYRALDSGK